MQRPNSQQARGGAVALAPEQAQHQDILRNVVQFCRLLRGRGMLVTPSEALDAVRAVEVVDVSDRQDFYLALRTVLVRNLADVPLFDATFEAFWIPQPPDPMAGVCPVDDGSELPGESRVSQEGRWEIVGLAGENESSDSDDTTEMAVYSPTEVVAQKDFSHFAADDLEDLARLTAELARQLATRLGRRTRSSRRGSRIDLRRSIRQNMKYGGAIIELARKQRKITKAKLVLICDVSRSMDVYSRFLLQFMYALQHTMASVETFVFSTSLTRVTEYFKLRDVDRALDLIGQRTSHWSGGTRIGHCLQQFNEEWLRSCVDRRTVILILSDGLDTGEPEVLSEALDELKERAVRVIWLNPYLGREGYQPLAKGMAAALPHLDVFAPAHNLVSLGKLERHLRVS
ncbi:MAG: VWA domain-containing protein [Chloroflexi bacterium]|nr:VWA domain-containing protein [Chloroflexota bacterium]